MDSNMGYRVRCYKIMLIFSSISRMGNCVIRYSDAISITWVRAGKTYSEGKML